jgi:hypothetical protein
VIHFKDDDGKHSQMSLWKSLKVRNASHPIGGRRGCGSDVHVSFGKQSITSYFDKELSRKKLSVQPKITTAFDIESKMYLAPPRRRPFKQMRLLLGRHSEFRPNSYSNC